MRSLDDGIKVSVLVPIYNMEPYLEQCLLSLACQTLERAEFICLDDGSTDNSPALLDAFASCDARFRVAHKPNSGYGDTMNLGLSMARGEYVGILESDDYAEPTMFEALYELAAGENCDIARGNRFDLKASGSIFKEVLAGLEYGTVFNALEDARIFDPAPCIWAQIYRRAFLEENGIAFLPTPGASFQDTGFVYKSYIAADRIVLTRDAHVHYRVDNATSSVKSSGKALCVRDEFTSIDDFARSRPERYATLAPKLAATRFEAYCWNLRRLDWPVKRSFLKATSDEIRSLLESGLLRELKASDLKRARLWAEDPEGFYLDLRIAHARKIGSRAELPLRLRRKLRP